MEVNDRTFHAEAVVTVTSLGQEGVGRLRLDESGHYKVARLPKDTRIIIRCLREQIKGR
jgi:hypothetical protein